MNLDVLLVIHKSIVGLQLGGIEYKLVIPHASLAVMAIVVGDAHLDGSSWSEGMEKVSLSISLIRNTSRQALRWLARLNERTSKLDFVVGHRLGKESFREAAIREIAWELRLDRKRDFLVSNMSQINLEFVDKLPGWFDKNHVLASFYNVEIYRQSAMDAIDIDSRNFWVRSDEICNGVTDCGRRFNPIVPYLINRSSVIREWESSQTIDRSFE